MKRAVEPPVSVDWSIPSAEERHCPSVEVLHSQSETYSSGPGLSKTADSGLEQFRLFEREWPVVARTRRIGVDTPKRPLRQVPSTHPVIFRNRAQSRLPNRVLCSAKMDEA